MLRSLPPAGHPIRMRTIFSAFLSPSEEVCFLKEFNSDIPIYLVSSGSAALVVALSCLKYQSRKNQVTLPAYSCPSVIAAIIKAGLEPVLCDLRPNSLGMDFDEVCAKTGPDTLAIIAVHLFGIPENIIELKGLAQKRGIILIEDAAQAFGNKVHLSPRSSPLNAYGYLGSFGDIGILSFGRGKPLSLLGGGATLINNQEVEALAKKQFDFLPQSNHFLFGIRYLINLFLYSVFYHPNLYSIPQKIPGLKLGETIFTLDFPTQKMNSYVLRIGNKLMPNFDSIRKRRVELMRIYAEKLESFKEEFAFFPKFNGEDIALLRFPMIFKDRGKRDRILIELKKRGLGATGMYPVPLNEQKGVSSYLVTKGFYPNAKFVSERILTLPIHEHVRVEDIDHIRQIIEKHFAKSNTPIEPKK